MSADNRGAKAKELSQPLVRAPMPDYEYQRQDDRADQPTFVHESSQQKEPKLDLSSVVFNFN